MSALAANASVDASKEASDAIPERKMPPPEPEANVRTRTRVVMAFWLVVLFLGLPVWWWTTSIHRAALPLQDMLNWADGRVGMNLSKTQSVGVYQRCIGLPTNIPIAYSCRRSVLAS